MDPSQVRKRILRDHRALRDLLLHLESELDALASDQSRLGRVAQAAHELLVELTAHTELEDAILAPTLRELDAWGPVRADMLLDHHVDQRRQLQQLLAAYDESCDPKQIMRLSLQLIMDVRADMVHEETTLLNKTLLRDDLVAVELEAG